MFVAHKATVIKQHIQDCEACADAYPDIFGKKAERKRKFTNEDVVNEVRKVEQRMEAKMKEMETRIISTVSHATRLPVMEDRSTVHVSGRGQTTSTPHD